MLDLDGAPVTAETSWYLCAYCCPDDLEPLACSCCQASAVPKIKHPHTGEWVERWLPFCTVDGELIGRGLNLFVVNSRRSRTLAFEAFLEDIVPSFDATDGIGLRWVDLDGEAGYTGNMESVVLCQCCARVLRFPFEDNPAGTRIWHHNVIESVFEMRSCALLGD